MAPRRHLPHDLVENIRELRADGRTCEEVARMIGGVTISTVRYHAPGRPGKVPVAPLREAFLASKFTAADVARELGWWTPTGADGSRVKHTLGLLPDRNGKGVLSWRTTVDAEIVERIADAIGVMPWEVMPDDDEENMAA